MAKLSSSGLPSASRRTILEQMHATEDVGTQFLRHRDLDDGRGTAQLDNTRREHALAFEHEPRAYRRKR